MKQFEFTVKDPLGLHARPCGLLVREVKKYSSKIRIAKGNAENDAGKLMALMGMGIKCGDVITVYITGEDEEAAAEGIHQFMIDNM